MAITTPNVLTIKEGKQFISELPDAQDNMIYVVTGPFCWGKNKNATKAAQNSYSNGWKGEYKIHLVNDNCEINSVDGTLYYNSKNSSIRMNIATFRQ